MLAALTAVVKAAAEELHGTAADDRHRYIVDLVVKRIKSVLDSSSEDTAS